MIGKISEKDLLEIQNTFREQGLIDATDTIEKYIIGSYYFWTFQTRGYWYFTTKKLIFNSFTNTIVIPYDKILEARKCLIGRGLFPILPIGIRIKFENEKGKKSARRMAVNKRKIWLEEILQRTEKMAA